MRLISISFVLLALSACGGSDVEQAREDTLAFVDTIEWPVGYEPVDVQVSDPSNAFNQGRSGNVNVYFDHQGESEPDLMAAFHESLTASGFQLASDASNSNICRPGRVRLLYSHDRHIVGSPELSYQVFDNGTIGLHVGMGWGVRPDGDIPNLEPSTVELPDCST